MSASLHIIKPEALDRFACTGCGTCCRLWGVPIDSASLERAKTFLADPPEPRPNPDLPWYVEQGGQNYYNLTSAGACVFLDQEKRCYLHRFDPELKSVVCRNYPYEELLTPRGCEISITFSSYGAFHQVLATSDPFVLAKKEASLNLAVPDAASPAIDDPRPLSWKTLFIIEDLLLTHMAAATSLDDALVECSRFLAAVEQHDDNKKLRRMLTASELTPALFVGQPSVSDLGSAYQLIEQILMFRRQFLDSSIFDAAKVDIEAMLDSMDKGPAEDGVPRALFYRRLARNYWDADQGNLMPIVKKFLLHKIFKKTFFLQYGLVRGFNIICFMYAVLRLQLLLNCRRDGLPPSVAGLFNPVHFVEVHFSHSGKFLEFWKEIFKTELLKSGRMTELLVRL